MCYRFRVLSPGASPRGKPEEPGHLRELPASSWPLQTTPKTGEAKDGRGASDAPLEVS